MEKALIVNGVSYDVPSDKLQSIIDTQFNYFKFPPRIKNLIVNDAITLDETLDDTDILSSRYIIDEDTAIQLTNSKPFYVRAGQFTDAFVDAWQYEYNNYLDTLNALYEVSRTVNDPTLIPKIENLRINYYDTEVTRFTWANAAFPNGYNIFPETEAKTLPENKKLFSNESLIPIVNNSMYNIWDQGQWVLPAKLNLGKVINGNEFLKPSTFIITPDMIENGENIFFNINVAVRLSQVYYQNPLIRYNTINYDGMGVTELTSIGKTLDNINSKYTTNTKPGRSNNGYDPRIYVYSNVRVATGLEIPSTVLIELKQRSQDNTVVKTKAVAGSFSSTREYHNNHIYVGEQIETELINLYNELNDTANLFKSRTTIYNNLLNSISDRSTNLQRNELNDANDNVILTQNSLNTLINTIIQKQQTLYDTRIEHLQKQKDLFDSEYSIQQRTKQPVEYLIQDYNVFTDGGTMYRIYNIQYMIDISKAKPWDEYYIETSAGTPYNEIDMSNTSWDIVPQSKISSII